MKTSTKQNIEFKFLAIAQHDDCIGKEQARDFIFCGDDDYLEQDEQRYQDWLNNKFFFCGINVVVEQHNWTTGNTITYKSAGLWGIESDCEESYLLQLAYEQAGELQAEFPNMPKFTCEDLKLTWK